jgi:outer membrane protein assembly factor BamE (lipoprotein component of BamABCDE complex)
MAGVVYLRSPTMRTACVAGCLGLILLCSSDAPAASKPTRADYDRVELGMTRAKVESILGPPDMVRRAGDSTFLSWGELFRSIAVQIVADEVVSKSHEGLVKKADASKVTTANYDRVRNGMTRQEVEALLGLGDDVQVNRTVVLTSWTVALGEPGHRYITVEFMNGKVAHKSQMGLE